MLGWCRALTLTYATSRQSVGHLASYGLPDGEGSGAKLETGVTVVRHS